jgi:hypothetical protein
LIVPGPVTLGPPWVLLPAVLTPPPVIDPGPVTLGPPGVLLPAVVLAAPGGGLALVVVSNDLKLLCWFVSVEVNVVCVAFRLDCTSVNALAPLSA